MLLLKQRCLAQEKESLLKLKMIDKWYCLDEKLSRFIQLGLVSPSQILEFTTLCERNNQKLLNDVIELVQEVNLI